MKYIIQYVEREEVPNSLLASVLWAPLNLCSQSLKPCASLSISLLMSTQFLTAISTLPLQELAWGSVLPTAFG